MSVVAWDGKTLAADCQATCAGLATVSKKIYLNETYIIAFTGDDDKGRELLAWYERGATVSEWPKSQDDKDRWTRLIVVQTNGCFMYEQTPYPIPILSPFTAWGSGRDYAVGAMQAGLNAREAVEVANLHSIDCGFGVEAYGLGELK